MLPAACRQLWISAVYFLVGVAALVAFLKLSLCV